jgi:hypothetical protein
MPGYTMRVERLDRERAMVVRSSNQAWVWSFELRPANGHTRLISRNRFDISALPLRDELAYPVIEPGSWVMERKMLLSIKQRAERFAHPPVTSSRGPSGMGRRLGRHELSRGLARLLALTGAAALLAGAAGTGPRGDAVARAASAVTSRGGVSADSPAGI